MSNDERIATVSDNLVEIIMEKKSQLTEKEQGASVSTDLVRLILERKDKQDARKKS